MKKMLLVLLLSALTASAHAEWTRIEYPSKAFVVYVENDTLMKPDPNSAKLWHLVDYTEPQSLDGRPFLSIKSSRAARSSAALSRSPTGAAPLREASRALRPVG